MSQIYAKVIVRHRNRLDELTYRLDEKIIPYIKTGSLVEVPLGKRIVLGVVTHLTKRIESSLKTKIRPIKTVAGEVSYSTIALIKKLSQETGAAFSQVAYWVLGASVDSKINNPKTSLKTCPKPLFIEALIDKRIEIYNQFLNQNQGFYLIVFDSLERARYFWQMRDDVLLFHQGHFLNKSSKSSAVINWQKIRAVISTSSGIFLSTAYPLTIIIDQVNSEGHSLKSRPFLNVKLVAMTRSAVEGHQVILSDEVVFPGELRLIKRGKITYRTFWQKKCSMEIARIFSSEPLSELTLERIDRQIQEKKSIAIYSLTNNWAQALCCKQCLECLSCLKCHRPLRLSSNELFCPVCKERQKSLATCPSCGGELKSVGYGKEQLKALLKRRYGALVFEANGSNYYHAKGRISIIKWPFNLFEQVYDICYFFNGDTLLASSELDSYFELAQRIRQLSVIAKKLVIMTDEVESEIWNKVTGNLEKLYVGEMKERFEMKLPPYCQELIFHSSLPRRLDIEEQYQHVCQEIKVIFSKAKISGWTIDSASRNNYQVKFSTFVSKTTFSQLKKIAERIAPIWAVEKKL